MLKKFIQHKKDVLFLALFFVVSSCLVFLFPYSGDDWAWGSKLGISRLNSWFENYNGRYAGNLLVLALTRNNLLKTIFIASSLAIACYLPKIFYQSKHNSILIFGTLLLCIIPKDIFVQSIVWTSGFSNYVPPIILTFIYFIIIRNIFKDKKPEKYGQITPIITFLLAFVSSLFMENLTLYNVTISAIIILFVLIKFKKFYLTHISFFVGSLVGTIVMFSNSVYTSIAENNDPYRSTAKHENLKVIIPDHINEICNTLFIKNILILFIISLLLCILTVKFIKSSNKKSLNSVALISLFINILTLGLLFAKNQFPYWNIVNIQSKSKSNLITIAFFFLIAFLYCISVLTTTIICVKENSLKFKLLLILISVPIMIAPLLFVNPIGPRCFFPPYLFLMMYTLGLFYYLIKDLKKDNINLKCFNFATIAIIMSAVFFLFNIYSTIYAYDIKRVKDINEQIENGQNVVAVGELPYSSYVWMGDPKGALWSKRFKMFNNIDSDIKFEFIPFYEWIKK